MATAAVRARHLTPAEKVARAVIIADRDHLMYRAKYHGKNAAGEMVFSVPSRTDQGRTHIVRRLPQSGDWACGCAAGDHGLPCGHIGAAYHYWRQIEQAMSEAGMRAQREYLDFAAFLETRGY